MKPQQTFAELLQDGRYQEAKLLLIEQEDRSSRGYTMARVALGYSNTTNGWGVHIEDAMRELLDANSDGVLQPPLSTELAANIDSYLSTPQTVNWALYQGAAAVLLAQVITHRENFLLVQ